MVGCSKAKPLPLLGIEDRFFGCVTIKHRYSHPRCQLKQNFSKISLFVYVKVVSTRRKETLGGRDIRQCPTSFVCIRFIKRIFFFSSFSVQTIRKQNSAVWDLFHLNKVLFCCQKVDEHLWDQRTNINYFAESAKCTRDYIYTCSKCVALWQWADRRCDENSWFDYKWCFW